jgi:eukaryotic-like serine/threonine-protein kinase
MTAGDVIEYLVAHGAYVEAARICVERGERLRAIRLYERVWRFADAVPLALEIGDRAMAVRLALDANQPARAAEIAAAIPADARVELGAVAEAFAGRGRPFEGARTAERGQDFRRAAALYRRAGAVLDEARARELAGELHEAGVLYERLAAQGAEDEAAAARLALGRLLARLGRHEEAARQLQTAARQPSLRTPAWRALAAPLLALGFRGAAAEVVARLRQDEPTLPPSPEEFVALEEAEVTAAGRAAVDVGVVRRRFRIQRMLGAGATGRVYLADDTLLGRPVALKLLQVGSGGVGPERQAYLRYAREAEAAGRLRHPNIVALYDADPALGLFVLELMTGGTLADRLSGGPLSPAAARRLGLDLLAALGAAHERGIVHRDVKPANVFFDVAGNAKLGDFGTAHLADFGQTQTGGFLGTVAYMAPEQITGATIGAAADLYALGVTLYEALTARPPFLGPDLVAQHLGESPPPPSSLRPALLLLHDRTLLRALAKAPGDRFASAAEMAEVLARWPVDLEPGAGLPAVAAPPPVPAAVPVRDEPETREIGRTASGRLLLHRDLRTGRVVLAEERGEPIDDEGRAAIRALAAAGGPYVQRVLRLDDDRRTIWYEAIEGEVLPLDAATPAERARLEPALSAWPGAAPPSFARTPTGPVLLVAPVVNW